MFFENNPFDQVRKDGSIQTEYTKELSELLPLIHFWLMPSVYPATTEEIRHKYQFIMEVLSALGLPLADETLVTVAEQFLADITTGADGGFILPAGLVFLFPANVITTYVVNVWAF